MKLVSIIMPVCNQGDEARRTVASARQSIADLPHEIILVDDQSLDESCHGMPRDILVVRSERRNGVSAARRLGFDQSRGDVILWSDPHCRFPAGCLKHLAQVAHQSEAIVQPKTFPNPNSRPRFGGKLVLSERGLRVARAYRQPADVPALIGTVYAMQRSIYERLGGWPKLPGIWGYSEQALTLASWFQGVPIQVDTKFTCVHAEYQPQGRFPFSVNRRDPAQNAHYVHAAFFPGTYAGYWRPMLEDHFGKHEVDVRPLKDKAFRELRDGIQRASIRNEKQFFREVLGRKAPQDAKPAR